MTSALKFFVECGDVFNAKKIFSVIDHDVIDYGQMMKCFNQQKMPLETLRLYRKMKENAVQPDSITYILLIDACAQMGLQSICQSISQEIPSAFYEDHRCQTALFHMWVSRSF